MLYAFLSQTVQTWREFGKGINIEKRNKELGQILIQLLMGETTIQSSIDVFQLFEVSQLQSDSPNPFTAICIIYRY